MAVEQASIFGWQRFVGNKGDRRGAFTCVDDKFLGKDEKVLVQLVCRDSADKERRLTAELAERC